MYRFFTSTLVAAALLLGSLPVDVYAQSLPRNMKPFVRLQIEQYTVETYRNPVIENGQITSLGTFAARRLTQTITSRGSGTVITEDGLILTNYHVASFDPSYEYDEANNVLSVYYPASEELAVYELADNDLRKPPVLRYKAVRIGYNEERDLAVLKITTDVQTSRPPQGEFAYVALGNPYDIAFNGKLTILGYPGKGGTGIIPLEGPFNGFYQGNDAAKNGSLTTVAAIAPGNSGGAALFRNRLVGVPTLGDNERGAFYGYLFPVTWAVRPLVEAKVFHGAKIPDLDLKWLESEFNPDRSQHSTFVAGRLASAQSNVALAEAVVILHRADRSLQQIQDLAEEFNALAQVQAIQNYFQQGTSVEDIAAQLQTEPQIIQSILRRGLDTFSSDVQRMLNGEFFFNAATADANGFYIVDVPRNQALTMTVVKDGFRDLSRSVQTRRSLYEDMGVTKLYQN